MKTYLAIAISITLQAARAAAEDTNPPLPAPGVQAALGLTGQQIAEIGELRRKSEQAISEINQGIMMNLVSVATGRMSQSDAKRANDARTAQTRRREAEFTASLGTELSADQQARLDTLKGAPFSFPPERT